MAQAVNGGNQKLGVKKMSGKYTMGKCYHLPEGMVINPLESKGRNLLCPCASGKKAKKCCGQYRYIKQYLFDQISLYLENYEMFTKDFPEYLLTTTVCKNLKKELLIAEGKIIQAKVTVDEGSTAELSLAKIATAVSRMKENAVAPIEMTGPVLDKLIDETEHT